MSKAIALDAFDRKLLEHLQFDAQTPIPILAEEIGLSAPACYRRIRRLRETGATEQRCGNGGMTVIIDMSHDFTSAPTHILPSFVTSVGTRVICLEGTPPVVTLWNLTISARAGWVFINAIVSWENLHLSE